MQKFEFCFEKFLSQKVEKEIKFVFISHLLYLEELMNQVNSIFSNLEVV